ncbi:hypothetical protein [Parasphingorhabdus sp.]|uniref:hypothetical protein n=1 Tax=Parasphingorhabdus sp. TaxID=2709688 RepID=UPI002F93015B
MKNRYGIYLGAMILASCGPAQNDPGPGGVTVGEAKALDDAAEMLDDRNIVLEHEAAKSKAAPQ